MNDKILTLFSVLLLATVVGLMSWSDLHPQNRDSGKGTDAVSGYYADNNATADMVPDDNRPVTIAQGEFRYSPEGKTAFIRQGMPPASFTQRQASILLRFEGMPKDPEKTLAKIKALVKDWENQGTDIAVIFLDYRPENPDFKAYSGFIKAFKKYFLAAPRVLAPVADAAWLDDAKKAGRQLLQEDVPVFLVEINEPEISAELLQKLANLGYRFQLKLPAETLPAGIDWKALQDTGLFAGGLLTLDHRKTFPKEEPKIGIFPKF